MTQTNTKDTQKENGLLMVMMNGGGLLEHLNMMTPTPSLKEEMMMGK